MAHIRVPSYYRAISQTLLFGTFFLFHLIGLAKNYSLPNLGHSDLPKTIPPTLEIRLGRAWVAQFRGRTHILYDPVITEYVEHLITRLRQKNTTLPPLTLVIIDDQRINAFAAPGGIIGINAGLFLYAENEAQFASVIAHELGHLKQRHFARGLELAKNNQPYAIITALASILVMATGHADAGLAALSSSQAALAAQALAFSRKNEQEADRIGLHILSEAGYPAQAMVTMFRNLQKADQYSHTLPPYLLTHPLTSERIADITDYVENYHNKDTECSTTSSRLYKFLQAKIKFYYQRSSQAIFNKALDNEAMSLKFSSSTLKQYRLSLQYKQSRQPQKALAILPKKNHILPILILRAQLLAQTQHTHIAVKWLRQKKLLFAKSYAVTYQYAKLLLQDGQTQKATALLTAISKVRPDDPIIWCQLTLAHYQSHNLIAYYLADAQCDQLQGKWEQALNKLSQAAKHSKNPKVLAKIRRQVEKIKGQRRTLQKLLQF